MSKILAFLTFLMMLSGCSKQKHECIARSKPKKNCMCTLIYAPVCGCDGKTYGNECEAACYGIKKFSQGECN